MKRLTTKTAVLAGLFAMVSLLWPMVALAAEASPVPCFEIEHADQRLEPVTDETPELTAAQPATPCPHPVTRSDERLAAAPDPLPALFGLRMAVARSPDLHRPPDPGGERGPDRMPAVRAGLSR